ncbi:MAG: NADH-quinone oxidoreductase subunit NuoF [Elusimicrobia bacterium]|nr:NADH-quinone oxidoreductase subunit NuoF [Elusimicrobiota bacterium]
MSPFTPEQAKALKAWTLRYPKPQMGLVEALRDVQRSHGWVRPEDEAFIAELFDVPLDRVHAVAAFYPYFTLTPAGKHRVCVCRNLSCHRRGGDRMLEHLRKRLGVPEGEATPDGLFSYEAVECLGACDHAPAFSVGDELVGAASEELIDKVIEDLKAGKPVQQAPIVIGATGPESGRKLLTKHFGEPELHRLEVYRRFGGYSALEKASRMRPADITSEVKRSNLRGLGGAGFPTGMKWETVPPKSQRDEPHYLVANADESEPGCYKDRALMERNPHALIEGLAIAARAVEADALFIFIRGEYARQKRILEEAIEEARKAGAIAQDIFVMRGAGAYISGCDTALLETMEGRKAWPRQPPPFPTVSGVFGRPTVVNNVETLMMLPAILRDGGEAFAKIGPQGSGGTRVYSVSGDVERPGIYEFPMGAPLSGILAAAGGVRGGRRLKAILPGGASTPVLTAEEAAKARMDFDGLRSAGSSLGAGGLVVLDETADMVETLHIIERFLRHESCGQCAPCREGSGWVARILSRILEGNGIPEDLGNLSRISGNVAGRVICALGDSVGMAAKAMIEKFPEDFRRRIHA